MIDLITSPGGVTFACISLGKLGLLGGEEGVLETFRDTFGGSTPVSAQKLTTAGVYVIQLPFGTGRDRDGLAKRFDDALQGRKVAIASSRQIVAERIQRQLADLIATDHGSVSGDTTGMLQNVCDFVEADNFVSAYWILAAYRMGWQSRFCTETVPSYAKGASQFLNNIITAEQDVERALNH
jgi:hypothetical protein